MTLNDLCNKYGISPQNDIVDVIDKISHEDIYEVVKTTNVTPWIPILWMLSHWHDKSGVVVNNAPTQKEDSNARILEVLKEISQDIRHLARLYVIPPRSEDTTPPPWVSPFVHHNNTPICNECGATMDMYDQQVALPNPNVQAYMTEILS